MATIEQIAPGTKLYLDANILIYYIEGVGERRAAAERSIEIAGARGLKPFTSEISIAECLYGAFKRTDDALIRSYRRLFVAGSPFSLVPVNARILEHAAELGASLGMKTLDAIHVASAMASGCGAMLTNDRSMRAPMSLTIISLDSAGSGAS